MKGKKHNPEQIIKKLREADAMIAGGKTVGQACQALEIGEQTLNRWRNQYGGIDYRTPAEVAAGCAASFSNSAPPRR